MSSDKDKFNKGIVRIHTRNETKLKVGAGVIINSDGIVFTCRHNVDIYSPEIEGNYLFLYNENIGSFGEKPYDFEIILPDLKDESYIYDFAILRIIKDSSEQFEYAELGFEPSHVSDEEKDLILKGIDLRSDHRFQLKTKRGPLNNPSYKYNNLFFSLDIDAMVTGGMSGGPVYSQTSRKVIGLTLFQSPDIIYENSKTKIIDIKAYAINISQIYDIIKEQKYFPKQIMNQVLGKFPTKQELRTSLFDTFIKNHIKYYLNAKEPQPFRPKGPELIDFEEGDWVYLPEITNDIFTDLQEGKIIILKGKPATGKSVISRYISFRTIKELHNDVFYFDLLNLSEIDIKKILHKLDVLISTTEFIYLKKSKENPLFVFENIHAPRLNQSDLLEGSFLPALKVLGEKVKILVTTRGDLKPFSWIEKKSKINLDEDYNLNQEIINGIIDNYNQKRLANGLNIIEWKIQEAPENLWLLGWYLRVLYTSEIGDSEVSSFQEIRVKLKEQIETYYSSYFKEFPQTNKIITVLVIISFFSKYETPVEEDFMLNYALSEFEGLNLDNTKQIIKLLTDKKEIISKKIEEHVDISVEKFEYRIPHIKLAEILQENFLNEFMKEKFNTIFNKYTKKGKNVDILGGNLWLQSDFLLAVKCFKLIKSEKEALEELIKLYSPVSTYWMEFSNKHVYKLKFSSLKITQIPKNLSVFPKLKILNLSKNEISKIERFEDLHSLQLLDLQDNLLNILPNSIENLISLEVLRLVHNPIIDLPESLKNINSLRKFYINLSRQVKKSNKNIQLFKKLKEKGVFIGSHNLNAESGLILKVSLAGDEEKDKMNLKNNFTFEYSNYGASTISMIGVDLYTYRREISQCEIVLQIWDLSGQERFRDLLPKFMQESNYTLYISKFQNKKKVEDFKNLVRISQKAAPFSHIILLINDKDNPADVILTDYQLDLLCDENNILKYVKLSTIEDDFLTLLYDEIYKSMAW